MFMQTLVTREIEARGGKVFAFDKGQSMRLIFEERAQVKLQRMRRHGSRKVKVAVRRAGSLLPTAALAAVHAAVGRRR